MAITENTVYTSRYSPIDNIVPPTGFFFIWESNTSRIDNINPISIEIMPLIKGTPIPNSSFSFQHELLAELHTSKDGYVIKSALIDEDGYGYTKHEAYTDFLTSIRDRYNSLKERKSRLSTDDLEILNNISSLLEPSK